MSSTHSSLPAVVPPPDTELEVLTLDAERRRARIEATLSAMTDRLERAKANVANYGERLEVVDDTVRRHRWPFVAASFVVGALLGRRRAPKSQPILLPAVSQSSQAERSTKSTALRSALGAFASYFARRAVDHFFSGRAQS